MSLPRSGTTSFAGLFDKFPATHEFMLSQTVTALLDWRERRISDDELIRFLHERDRLAGHFVDSAAFFFLAPEIVIRAFPDANFFFSVRDCESWIVSLIDLEMAVMESVRNGTNTIDLNYHDRYALLFSPRYTRGAFQSLQKLREKAGPMLADIAVFWRSSTISTLEKLSGLAQNKRLVIHLRDFSNSTSKMAKLAGVDSAELNTAKVHMNKDFRFDEVVRLIGRGRIHQACIVEQQSLNKWLNAHRPDFPDLFQP